MNLSYREAGGRQKSVHISIYNKTHLKVVVEERQDDGREREDEEDAKGREGKLNLEDIQQGSEQDGESMTV